MRIHHLSLWIPLIVALFANNSYATETNHKPPANIEELQQSINQILKERDIPGAAVVLISSEGIQWIGNFGKADVSADKPVTTDTIFRIGSISKSFVSVAMLMLQERGLIDLNAKLKDLAPEITFENPWEDTQPVRIVHLLEHTTGFDDIHLNEYALNGPGITLKKAIDFSPASRKSRWQPGQFMSYCNSGPSIAAYVLEKATGQRYEDFVQENIFDRLGMKTSSFFLSDTVQKHLSKGYPGSSSLADLMPFYSKDGAYFHTIFRPSGSMNSTATELAAFVQMLMNRGTYKGITLLSPESVARMERPYTTMAARRGISYGYGLGNFSYVYNGFVFQGHDGGLSGYLSSAKYLPEHGLGFVILQNKSNVSDFRALDNLVACYIARNLEKPEAPFIKLNKEKLSALTGYYEPATDQQQMMHVISRFTDVRKVILENGRLFFEPFMGGKKQELIPMTEDRFRTPEQSDATMVFVKDGGSLYWLSPTLPGFGNFVKTSAALKVFELTVYIVCFCLMASSFLFALIWLPRKVFGRMNGITHLSVRVLPLSAIGIYIFAILVVMTSSDPFYDLGNRTVRSISFFLLILAFAVLSMVGLVNAIHSFKWKMNRVVRLHSLLVSTALTVWSFYLWYWGFIGWRSWK